MEERLRSAEASGTRWRIVQSLTYTFEPAAAGLDLEVRLSTLGIGPQAVDEAMAASPLWDSRADSVDTWGNRLTTLGYDRPLRRLSLSARVDVPAGSTMPLPEAAPGPADGSLDGVPSALVEACRAACRTADTDRLRRDVCFALLLDGFTVDGGQSRPDTDLETLWFRRSGVCQDIVKLCVAGLRACGLPARFVVGYRCGRTPMNARAERHAWLAAYLDGCWVASDPTPGFDPEPLLVATAWGAEFLTINPVIGIIRGPAVETRLTSSTQIELI